LLFQVVDLLVLPLVPLLRFFDLLLKLEKTREQLVFGEIVTVHRSPLPSRTADSPEGSIAEPIPQEPHQISASSTYGHH
jgi:hypothetical protein